MKDFGDHVTPEPGGSFCTVWSVSMPTDGELLAYFVDNSKAVKLNRKENDTPKTSVNCGVTSDEFNPITHAVTPDTVLPCPS